MADQKTTDFPPLAEPPDLTDLLSLVDVSDTTDDADGSDKQITVGNLLAAAWDVPLTGLGSETGAVVDGDTLREIAAKVNDRLPVSGGAMTGDITFANAGVYNQPQIRLSEYETGVAMDANTRVSIISNAIGVVSFKAGEGVLVRSSESIGFSTGEVNGGGDVRLWRGGSGILQQRNSTTAQEVQVYGSYTSSSIYERLAIRTAAGDYLIAAEAAGGGTLRNLKFNGANRSAYIASPTNEQLRDIVIAWGLMAAS